MQAPTSTNFIKHHKVQILSTILKINSINGVNKHLILLNLVNMGYKLDVDQYLFYQGMLQEELEIYS